MKYIDSEKLKAEIERCENTAIDAYNPHGEDADFWYGKVVACGELKTLITSLKQEQPPLPSNLDEAAENSWAEYEYRESPRGLYSTCYLDGFKAGAEWMAGQEHIADVSKMMPEVELERLLNLELPDMTIDDDLGLCTCDHFGNHRMTVDNIKEIARHFYELGKNSK